MTPPPVPPRSTQPSTPASPLLTVSGGTQPLPPAPPLMKSNELSHRSRRMGRGTQLRLILLFAAVIVLIASLGLLYYQRSQNTTNSLTVNTATAPINSARPIENTSINSSGAPLNQPIKDSDGDGLLDDEEQQLGTDPHRIDSDGDGVIDRQEAHVYHSNPLKSDTDGDGYTDGDEIRNFFDPNGPGKLIDPSQLIQGLQNQPTTQP